MPVGLNNEMQQYGGPSSVAPNTEVASANSNPVQDKKISTAIAFWRSALQNKESPPRFIKADDAIPLLSDHAKRKGIKALGHPFVEFEMEGKSYCLYHYVNGKFGFRLKGNEPSNSNEVFEFSDFEYRDGSGKIFDVLHDGEVVSYYSCRNNELAEEAKQMEIELLKMLAPGIPKEMLKQLLPISLE